ncbi:IDEAL domain-containing protein [Lysinibacillus sp. Ag94]|uniref:IDEAL domain-containing protein n=1 Tax=Lysinibacillus sp. Ag94 TaxID=2936682 RepID=UPI00200E0044|nr:IDEAL domain-containing protein [Lysinibacillus sp. Ag94]UPW82350.1 IDEAL domain-containing protein [Lysinibacillus sp. Ag94]
MTNPNPFQQVSDFVAKMGEAYREFELNNLMTELEEFNIQNYKDAAIDVALETGDREAFYKLMGVNEK